MIPILLNQIIKNSLKKNTPSMPLSDAHMGGFFFL